MPHKCSADSPSLPARVLPKSEVATSSGFQPPVEDPVFVDEDESRPEGQVQSAASCPILSAEDFYLRSPVGSEPSSSMPHLESYWKDDFVFQDPSSLMTDSSFLYTGDANSVQKNTTPCDIAK